MIYTTSQKQERAKAYISKLPPAISGQRGHDTTFNAAQVIVRGFDLTPEQAKPVWDFYNSRCNPPWNPKESLHKLEDAYAKSRLPSGYLLNDKDKGKMKNQAKIVARYTYRDKNGNARFNVLRYENKKFSTSGTPEKIPYKLPEVVSAIQRRERILLVEGEKDTETAFQLGFTATTNAHGAQGWKEEHADYLKGACVVIIPDKDPAGYNGAFIRAKSLFGKAKKVYWLELPGEVKDLTEWVESGGTKEQLLDQISTLKPIDENFIQKLEQQKETENRKAESKLFGGDDTTEITEDPFPEAISYDAFKPETDEDPQELLRGSDEGKGRILCKRHIALLSGETGVGKSTLITQLAIMFALGQPLFGLTPKRPLKIFMFQAENDERDMWEKLDGTIENVVKPLGLEGYEATLKKNLLFERESCGLKGEAFTKYVKKCCDVYHPDLIIADPLFSYIGSDVSDQGKVSDWIRNLFELCKKECFAMFIIHHFNKPRGEKKDSTVYSASGSAELMNTARVVFNIERKIGRFYRFSVFKRDDRLGWKDASDNQTNEILIKRAVPPFEFWSELDPEDLAELKDDGKRSAVNVGRPKRQDADAVLKVLCILCNEPNSKGISFSEWKKYSMEQLKISERTFANRRAELLTKQTVAQYEETGFYYPLRRI